MLLFTTVARAEAPGGQVEASLHVFGEPASSQPIAVVTPALRGRADIKKWISVGVDWTADIVTGATPRTYGTPDAVTAATPFDDVRSVQGARAEFNVGPFTASAGYHYGIERDYRSHVLSLGAKLDLFQHNTTLALDYAHDFDSVCDLDNGNLPVTLRQPLTKSHGCFAGTPGLTEEPVAIDDLVFTWTQVLAPRWIAVVGATYQHIDGFQSNPYRRVRLDGGTLFAQESHPRLRDRGSVNGRLRYAVLAHAVMGLDLRFYNDSWGIYSGSGDLSWDQEHFNGKLRWRAHVRYYQQTHAVFYRDAGWSNSYERAGPAGQYFTGDREMAPFGDLVVGGVLGYHKSSDKRMAKMFKSIDVSLDLDLVKVFALSPLPPNLPRMSGVIDAVAAGLSFIGEI
jgi:hypothetical protein